MLRKRMVVAADGRIWIVGRIDRVNKIARLIRDYRRDLPEWKARPYVQEFPLRIVRRVRAR